jgi:hypothetical protein
MSWVNDLASSLGIPAGAATLAVAMYAACGAAEKVARPEALKDIGRILKDPSWSGSVRPSAIVERVFIWTFGERHLSWKCVRRSMIATLFLIASIGLVYSSILEVEFVPIGELRLYFAPPANFPPNFVKLVDPLGVLVSICISFILLAAIPDYIALWKTRVLIRQNTRPASMILIVLLDVVLSIIVSLGVVVGWYLLLNATKPWWQHGVIGRIWQDLDMALYGILGSDEAHDLLQLSEPQGYYSRDLIRIILNSMVGLFSGEPNILSPLSLFLSSTLLTSLWMTLILMSAMAVKLLAPLQRFTAWFFDVDRHPVKAIGIVSGALVVIGSLIWSLVRAVI